ncbi:MAG: hypothetical protein RRA92_03095 [Gemmatimonadota bacterium]|nr:hypothetical protein [Gemmatimonadota bacterium]
MMRNAKGCATARGWRWTKAAVVALLGLACTDTRQPGDAGFPPVAETSVAWAQHDSVALHSWMPLEVKAESGTAAWIADAALGGVLRFAPGAEDYRQMGMFENPPEEMTRPVKLAFSRQFGLFVYDLEAREVQVYSPGGQPLRTFDPGFQPARMELTSHPIGLIMAHLQRDADSVARLVVVHMDLRGAQTDTLLSPGSRGPAALWDVPARGDSLSLAPSEAGMWAYSKAISDTVFEISAQGEGRRIVLRPQDRDALGILADLDRDILWVVRPDPEATAAAEEKGLAVPPSYRYSAYDISRSGDEAATVRDAAFLGERRTPEGFEPRAAAEGIVIGWMPGTPYPNLAGVDMRVSGPGR